MGRNRGTPPQRYALILWAALGAAFVSTRALGAETAAKILVLDVDPIKVSEMKPKEVFLSLLSLHKKFPQEYYTRTDSSLTPKTYDQVQPAIIENLSETVLSARYKKFNVSYVSYLKLSKRLQRELKILDTRLKSTPVSNYKVRSDLEVKHTSLRASYDQALYLLFMTSLNANQSVLDALNTLPPDQRVARAPVGPPPKLPGVFQGSAADRSKLSEAEKIFMTPVDAEFYKTQLGKKLANDLGGKADYWSYDYGSDELYVKVGDDLGKLTVFQDQGGVRFIRTRVGSSFNEQKSPDTRIDMASAQGRFLTGDKAQESLFGRVPTQGGKEDVPAPHSDNNSSATGADENHDHPPGK